MRTTLIRAALACAVLVTLSVAPALAQSQVRGKVVDAKTGEPIEGARVSVQTAMFGWDRRGERTDAEGKFRVQGLTPGRYVALARSGCYWERQSGFGGTTAEIIANDFIDFSGRAIIDVLGHLIFLLPFCVLIAWLSRHFVEMSFVSHEQSNYGGLTDRWIIKAALPLGLLFLAVNALGQVLENIAFLLDPKQFPDRLEKAHAG